MIAHITACIAAALLLLLPNGLISDAAAAERTFGTGNFTAVRIVGDIDVEIVQGPTQKVIATGANTSLSRFSVRSSGGILTVTLRAARTTFSTDTPVLRITAPQLRAITYQGNGFLDVDRLAGDTVEINLIGTVSSWVRGVDADILITSMTSAGSLILEGSVERHEIAIGGYGEVNAANLLAHDVNIVAEGTVTLIVYADGDATGLASEGAKVNIIGGAQCDNVLVAGAELLDTSVICGGG